MYLFHFTTFILRSPQRNVAVIAGYTVIKFRVFRTSFSVQKTFIFFNLIVRKYCRQRREDLSMSKDRMNQRRHHCGKQSTNASSDTRTKYSVFDRVVVPYCAKSQQRNYEVTYCSIAETAGHYGALQLEAIPRGVLEGASYLLMSEGEAILIHPSSRTKLLLSLIQRAQVKLKYIILTERSSISGEALAELRSATGALVIVHEQDMREVSKRLYRDTFFVHTYSFVKGIDFGVTDGCMLRFGSQTVEIIQMNNQAGGNMCVKCNDMLFTGKMNWSGSSQPDEPRNGRLRQLSPDNCQHLLTKMSNNFVVYPAVGNPYYVNYV